MRRLLFLVPFGFLLFSFACDTNDSEIYDVQIQDVQIDIGDPKTFKISQFFDTCFIIPLDNRELVGAVGEVFVDDQGVLVVDERITKKVYLYDWEGSLKKFISKEGDGPGEYLYPRDAQFVGANEVMVNSAGLNKLIYVNVDTDQTKDVFLDSVGYLADFKFFGGKNYFVVKNESGKNGIIKTSENLISDLFEISISEKYLSQDRSRYGSGKGHFLYPKSSGNGFYFSDVNTPYFLEFENDKLKKAFKVSLSERELDYSKIEIGTERSALQMAKNEKLIYFSNHILVANDVLFLGLDDSGFGKMAIWDKKSEKGYFVEKIENDIAVIPNISAFLGEYSAVPGYFVFVIEAGDLINILGKLEENDNPYLGKLRGLDIQKDDNPVLFIYRFKEDIDLD